MNFAIKRFKGFWNQFKRSKRGLLGAGLIVFFSLIAIFASLIAPFQPIDPVMNVGDYPAAPMGIPIAEKLAKPVWYTYLPWISRGEIEVKESFYDLIKYYPGVGLLQTFAHVGQANASDSDLFVYQRISSVKKVVATYPNETVQELASPADWYVLPSSVREIALRKTYENGTTFDVDYITGTDLVENMQVVQDHSFNSNQSLNEWASTTDYPNLTSISYNTQKGFSLSANPSANRGCLQISFQPSGSLLFQPVRVTISRPFTYPYFEPPVSFRVFASLMVEGTQQVNVTVMFSRENETRPFRLTTLPINSSSSYANLLLLSSDAEIISNIGLNPPQDKIFATPGKYNLSIQIEFPPVNTKVYVDDVNAILYGNIFGIMGTDHDLVYPRDLFSLLVYGSRVSLIVGILAALFSTLIGLFLGLAAGYLGGILDEGIMRFADLLLVLPTLPLFIILIVALRTISGAVSIWNIIIILTLFGWMSFARSVRSMVLSLRERVFIEAAKAAGAGKLHIMNRHIIPNVFALVYITLAMAVPSAIITEATLSWLGLGDPLVASWGKILYDFNVSGVALTSGLTEYWFWIFPPCIAIAVLATAFILVGYALDEILNPRLRERR